MTGTTERTFGRQYAIGPTDLTSEKRTPSQPLRLIPAKARASFVPFVERAPGLRAGENDLTRLAPGRPRAEGEVISLSGRLLDEQGRPQCGVLLEIWNANKWGRYTHVDDPGNNPLDPNFVGNGRTLTDETGAYRFLTINPAAYLARPDIDRWRPKHVHFSVIGGTSRMITQMYFPDDPLLAKDPCFHLLGAAGERHIAKIGPSSVEDAIFDCRFDIVLGGRSVSWFEEN